MIQSFKDIYNQVLKITQFDIANSQIQKVYSSAYTINLVCRKPGNSFSLFLGRGHGYEGIWLSDKKLDSNLRKIDHFLEYLRKHLTSTTIISLELDERDRIIYLDYFKSGKLNRFGFFYKARDLYFAHSYYDLSKSLYVNFKSWKKGNDLTQKIELNFSDLEIQTLNQNKENKYVDIDNILKTEEKSLVKTINKKLEKAQRKVKNIEADLEKIKNYTLLSDFADQCEDLSKLDKKINIKNIRINFQEKEHYKRRNELFLKSKGLKSKITLMENRLKKSIEELELIKKQSKTKSLNTLKTVKPVFYVKNTTNIAVKNSSVPLEYDIIIEGNLKFGIGRSASGNDLMRKEWAKKEDIWFHLDQESSPHVISKGQSSVDDELLKKVARLIKLYSKSSKNEFNLIYTQVKNLKGIKGIKGSVNYKKEKHIKVII